MPGIRMQQAPPREPGKDAPVPPAPSPTPVEDPDIIDPAQQPPPVQDPGVDDPTPGPQSPPVIA